MYRKLILLLILIFFADITANSQENWKLRKNEDGIKIYTLERGKAIEFKGIITIDVPVSKLTEVLKDVDSYHLWMADLRLAKKLKVINDNEWYAWYAASVPWPMEDRDVIYKVNVFKQNESTLVTLKSKPDFVPENKNFVRVNVAEGKWVFTPVDENKTRVMYQFYTDPEINVPMWLTNLFIVSGPFETLKDLKEIILYDKYSN